jgi:hypothetical protein
MLMLARTMNPTVVVASVGARRVVSTLCLNVESGQIAVHRNRLGPLAGELLYRSSLLTPWTQPD